MPGGWVTPISQSARDRIAKLCPPEAIAALESAFQYHCIELQREPEAGRAIRDKLSLIAEKAVMLRAEMQTMSEDARHELWDAIGVHDGPAFAQEMIEGLSRLSGASRVAHNAVEIIEGRPPSARQAFVRSVAASLEGSGVKICTRPNGGLCQIVGILLTELDDCPSDVPALVRNSMRNNPAKSG